MNYDEIQTLRKQIIAELVSEFPGLPLSIEHYKLAEMRVQTALLGKTETADVTVKTNEAIAENLEELMKEKDTDSLVKEEKKHDG